MRAFMFGIIFIAISTASDATPASDCKMLKSPTARLACYDAQNKAAPRQKQTFGKIQGVITWQYNNFVGTKGDVGAKIILVSDPVDERLKKLGGPEAGLLSLGYAPPKSEQYGIYSADADGFGNFSIDGVPVGRYQIFVFSSKTTPGPDDYMTNICKAEYAKYFANMHDYKDLAFKVHKVYCTSADVMEDRATTISHDFGNTYI